MSTNVDFDDLEQGSSNLLLLELSPVLKVTRDSKGPCLYELQLLIFTAPEIKAEKLFKT